MAEHTPGPWEVRPIPGMNQIAIAQPGMMYPFASVGPWQDSREPDRKLTGTDYANALLIAAAPDLLAALKKLVEVCNPDAFVTLEPARAAIAKAGGGR